MVGGKAKKNKEVTDMSLVSPCLGCAHYKEVEGQLNFLLEQLKSKIDGHFICEFLNSLLEIDRKAIENLVEARVPCKQELADHPNVHVYLDEDGQCKLGFLGLLNGILLAKENRILVAFYDEFKLKEFKLKTLEELKAEYGKKDKTG